MAKRGEGAKNNVVKKIQEAFGEDFVGIKDKKIYVNAIDSPNNEKLQIAITLTLPKATMDTVVETTNFEDNPTELSSADKRKVEDLKKILGVSD